MYSGSPCSGFACRQCPCIRRAKENNLVKNVTTGYGPFRGHCDGMECSSATWSTGIQYMHHFMSLLLYFSLCLSLSLCKIFKTKIYLFFQRAIITSWKNVNQDTRTNAYMGSRHVQLDDVSRYTTAPGPKAFFQKNTEDILWPSYLIYLLLICYFCLLLLQNVCKCVQWE